MRREPDENELLVLQVQSLDQQLRLHRRLQGTQSVAAPETCRARACGKPNARSLLSLT